MFIFLSNVCLLKKKSTLKTLSILLKLIIVSEYIQKLEQKSEFIIIDFWGLFYIPVLKICLNLRF